MLNTLKSFQTFLLEATNLVPAELKKSATAGPYKGQDRTDILADLIKKQIPLELKKGGKITVANIEDCLIFY